MISLSSIGETQQGLLVWEMADQPREKMANTVAAAAAAASLTDDLIVDILSRLPVKSLCRCKCVSPHWRDLISHPDHRHRLPQTLAGFFRNDLNNGREVWRFTNLCDARQPPLISTPFAFMPGYEDITIVDACNGLLLCRPPKGSPHHMSRYVVCNPANKSWVVLPDSGSHSDDAEEDEPFVTRLGFDPAVSQHFYVFEIVENDFGTVAGVEIYSSETGAWSYKESQWNYETNLFENSRSVFLNGLLHFSTVQFEVVAVDVVGESWWVLPAPEDPDDIDDRAKWDPGFLGRYQGHLCYMTVCYNARDLAVWLLEDYSEHGWVLKHQVTIRQLTEKIRPLESYCYHLITVHPDCNWILYLTGSESRLMAYDMDHDEVHVIQNLRSRSEVSCIPFVPFYAKSLTEG
jgi:F-box interacting protein